MQKTQAGFAHIIVVAVMFVAIVGVGFFVFQSINNSSSKLADIPRDQLGPGGAGDILLEERPYFTRLPFDLTPDYENGSRIWGDVDCSGIESGRVLPPLGNCALPFNRTDPLKPSGNQIDTTFRLTEGSPVYAGMEGIVLFSSYQPDSGDYDVHIANANEYDPRKYTYVYSAEFDHLADIRVKEGDRVRPDTVIGTVPCGTEATNQAGECGYYRFELQMNQVGAPAQENGPSEITHLCYYDFTSPEVQAGLDALLAASNTVFSDTAFDSWCL